MKDIFERDMAGAIPLQRPAEKKKPPPAASEKPFDRRGKLR